MKGYALTYIHLSAQLEHQEVAEKPGFNFPLDGVDTDELHFGADLEGEGAHACLHIVVITDQIGYFEKIIHRLNLVLGIRHDVRKH